MSLIVGQYYQDASEQKPKQWGPESAVESIVTARAKGIGFSPVDVLPLWEACGNVVHNYGTNGRRGINNDMAWDNDYIKGLDYADRIEFGPANKAISGYFFDYTPGVLLDAGGVLCGLYTSLSSRAYFRFTSATAFKLYIVCGGVTTSLSITVPTMYVGQRYQVFWQVKDGDFWLYIDGKYIDRVAISNADEFKVLSTTANYYIDDRGDQHTGYYGKNTYYAHSTFCDVLTDYQIKEFSDNAYQLVQPPTFHTYFMSAEAELSLILANINQSQTIDNVDLLQQSILDISEIEQAQEIENILFSLSILLSISGIRQAQLLDNLSLLQQIALAINAITQQQEINSLDLIQQAILAVQKISQDQVIDNLTLLSAIILTIAKLNQAQEVDTLTLLQQSNITIADTAQSQLLDNIVLLYGDVLVITGISQGQTSDNISFVQQNLLSVADINQVQITDSVTLSVAGLLEIAKLTQEQNLDIVNLTQNFALTIDSLFQTQDVNNIILDSSQILAIQQLVQTQLVDVISLVQQSVLNVDEISQQQILDNIEIVITRIAGKLSITFQLKTPGGRFTLR